MEKTRYTGLRDQHREKIYEGDILTFYNRPDDIDATNFDKNLDIGYVVFINDDIRITRKGYKKKEYWRGINYIFAPEIISNIYENPKLLKKEQVGCFPRAIYSRKEINNIKIQHNNKKGE